VRSYIAMHGSYVATVGRIGTPSHHEIMHGKACSDAFMCSSVGIVWALTGMNTCRIDSTKKVTSSVASVTTAVAGAIGTAIGSVAHATISGIKKTGVGKEGSSTHRAGTVGKAGVVALVEVFDAMHDAGRNVVKQGATETATCVEYRCGYTAWSHAEGFIR
jgi:hypothetical protein